jgi:hypothetical protein
MHQPAPRFSSEPPTQEARQLAKADAEKWVRASGRRQAMTDADLGLELRCRTGGDELTNEDVVELVALARRLGSASKDADELAEDNARDLTKTRAA